MADTKFEAGTVISSAWLNDVNRAGSISIYDGGDARAYGTIVGNQSTSLTTNLAARAKWHIAANEAG